MSKIPLLLFFLFLGVDLSAQIGGLSASKLDAFCAGIVNKNKIEFEPAFYHFSGNKYWNNKRHLENRFNTPDSIWNVSGMQFRFTYGLFDRLEVGVSLPVNASVTSWGIKYIV